MAGSVWVSVVEANVPGKLGLYFKVLDCAWLVGVVVVYSGAVMGFGDTKVSEQ